MASIQSSGVNLDVRGLVSQLVSAERAKDDARINRQETSLTVQLSGVSSLKGALSAFQELAHFAEVADDVQPAKRQHQ